MQTQTENMQVIDLEMSNYDHSIDDGFEDVLKEHPGKVYGYYYGWDFCARVWYLDNLFHAEVWRYGTPVEIISADTLNDIMSDVSDKYGWD